MALIEVRERAAASSTCHPPQVGSAVPAPTTRKTSQSASCHGQALVEFGRITSEVKRYICSATCIAPDRLSMTTIN